MSIYNDTNASTPRRNLLNVANALLGFLEGKLPLQKHFSPSDVDPNGHSDLLVRHRRLSHGQGKNAAETSTQMAAIRHGPALISHSFSEDISSGCSAQDIGEQSLPISEVTSVQYAEPSASADALNLARDGQAPLNTSLSWTQPSSNFGDFALFIDGMATLDGHGSSMLCADQPILDFSPAPIFGMSMTGGIPCSTPRPQYSNVLSTNLNRNSSTPQLYDDFTSSFPSFEPPTAKHSKRDPFKVTQQDWDHLFAEIGNFDAVLPSNFTLPSRHTLTRYIATYFSGFHRHLPMLHIPTFSATQCPVELVLAIATIGAQSAFDHTYAIMLFQTAWAIVQTRLRDRKSERRERSFASRYESKTPQSSHENTDQGSNSAPTIIAPGQTNPLPLAQTLLIPMAMATWGNSSSIFNEAMTLQSTLSHYIRDENLLRSPPHPGEAWISWIRAEEFNRTIAIIFDFFYLLCDEDKTEEYSSLGGYTLILALIQHIYLRRETCPHAPGSARTLAPADVANIEQALKNWQTAWYMDPEAFLGPGSPRGPISFNASALLRMAYIRLTVDLGPYRTLNTHDPHEIAMAMHNSPAVTSSRKLTRAVLYSAHALSIPIKIGVNIVARNQAFAWSLQHSLCALECAYVVSKWLAAIQPRVREGSFDVEEARLLTYLTDLVGEADSEGEPQANQSDLRLRVIRVWAKLLSGVAVWDVWKYGGLGILGNVSVDLGGGFSYLFPTVVRDIHGGLSLV
ncbi:hypothetical protein N7512_003752 [Penicillium capsulatum]|nr:hypothetical protein N7512_003752 [Penicillium capsulatum]